MAIAVQEKKVSLNNFRQGMMQIESAMLNTPGALVGDAFPLKHQFAEGMYVREISVPKGYFVMTKIHKMSHPCFILKGRCSVLQEDGIKRVKAPYYMITKAGTKRLVYVHEDTVWVTVHKTNETDLDKIEEEVIAKTFDELPDEVKTMEFIEHIKEDL
jgi:hypothetical protein